MTDNEVQGKVDVAIRSWQVSSPRDFCRRLVEVLETTEIQGGEVDVPEGARFAVLSETLIRTIAESARQAAESEDTTLTRIRGSVGRAIGIQDDVPLTYDAIAEAVDRIARAAAGQPGMSLLARDLDSPLAGGPALDPSDDLRP